MTVHFDTRDGIAFVTIDNPPVNATNQPVRQGLHDALARAEAGADIVAVVLACAGRTFIAGADIREFDGPPVAPHLPDLLLALERATKPWVAAIHGTALGGGLETALACAGRVASSEARMGFPEVTLGLVPGAGGTVRLPRVVPAGMALEMIATGKPVDAETALAAGLIDRIATGDPVAAAATLARDLVEGPPRLPTSQRPVRQPDDAQAFDAAAQRIEARARGQHAPVAAVQALRDAMRLPPDAALAAERALFLHLKAAPQSAALRHIFLAERAAARTDGIANAKPRDIARIGIVGGGAMGAGIAAACLLAGLRVTIIERDDSAADSGRERVTGILDDTLRRGLLSPDAHADRLAAFAARTGYAALADADLVIEAVFEDMAVKKQVFAQLDTHCRPDAVLATNTSYLDVGEIARATRDPSRVLGLHFFSPAHIMKLLEVVAPTGLDRTALATGLALARRLHKVAVIAGVCDGFIGNRIMSAYRAEAEFMLEDGALPWDIDAAMEAFGFPMGLFRMQDLAGLDISWAMRKRRAASRDPAARYVAIGDRLCEAGHFGQKTGRGYYSYDSAGTPRPNRETEALILSESARKAIPRRAFTQDEIMDRLLAAMRSEGQRILDEGIARTADDIDVVMVNAYGFPRWKGGPMFGWQR